MPPRMSRIDSASISMAVFAQAARQQVAAGVVSTLLTPAAQAAPGVKVDLSPTAQALLGR
jgi:hypothetical protein